jgi:hypothetical protein
MKFLALLFLALLQYVEAADPQPQANPDRVEIQLVVPNGYNAGFGVLYNDNGHEGGFESFHKIDNTHNIVIRKLEGNRLKVQWGPYNSTTLNFTVDFRLVDRAPQFENKNGLRSAIVGYIKINGVDQDIRVVLSNGSTLLSHSHESEQAGGGQPATHPESK